MQNNLTADDVLNVMRNAPDIEVAYANGVRLYFDTRAQSFALEHGTSVDVLTDDAAKAADAFNGAVHRAR
jgi:hypothetical protein